MGCTSSRSQDLPRLTLLTSNDYMQSVHNPPEYFIKSVQTSQDFIGSIKKNKDPEMSYNGPPSHLESSADVHPFWAYHGLDFYKKYLSNTKADLDSAPQSLFPSTETAQELRQIEVNEAITDLRQQVIGVIAAKKSDSDSLKDLTYDEKLTIEFLESVIRAEDDAHEDYDNLSVQNSDASESNWILETRGSPQSPQVAHVDNQASVAPDSYDHPVPGYMYDIVTECDNVGQDKPVEGDGSFLHKPVYLPDNDILIVDADCEIGANTKTHEEEKKSDIVKMSESSVVSDSIEQSTVFTQRDTEPLTDIEPHEVFVDLKHEEDAHSSDFVKTIYPEILHSEHDTTVHHSSVEDSREENHCAAKAGDYAQSGTSVHGDDDVRNEFSVDTARSASATVVRGSKVQSIVQMYDQKVRESFGEADRKRRQSNPVRQSEEPDVQLNEIAELLLTGADGGKTQSPKLYDHEVSGITLNAELQQPDHQNSSNIAACSSLLGQIKTDLVLLQQGKNDEDEDDDDDGIQESIDSGFAN